MNARLTGRIGIKLRIGEQHGPNIIPREWVKNLIAKDLPDAHIVETNSYCAGARDTTKKHRAMLAANGWDFAPVDVMDEFGAKPFPVPNGKWFKEMYMGAHLDDYDLLLALTHF